MKLAKLSRLAISDEGFVFNPLTGSSYTINHSAKKILRQLIAGNSEEEAALSLMKDFHISEQAAERDLQDFLRQLRTLELI
jgi:PqqD family protein of HPr-rel-A system